jgi:PAB1-binding protein PBP1
MPRNEALAFNNEQDSTLRRLKSEGKTWKQIEQDMQKPVYALKLRFKELKDQGSLAASAVKEEPESQIKVDTKKVVKTKKEKREKETKKDVRDHKDKPMRKKVISEPASHIGSFDFVLKEDDDFDENAVSQFYTSDSD